jgi:hypothetical protein
MATAQALNWYAGWILILAAFITGAAIGLFFHRDDFLGGYTSFRRRLMRLGHIALAALGAINILFSISTPPNATASVLLLIGALSMSGTCFLTAWREGFRHLFFIPVTSLLLGVVAVLIGGAP